MAGMTVPLSLTQTNCRFRTVNAVSAPGSAAFDGSDPPLNNNITVDISGSDVIVRLRIVAQGNADVNTSDQNVQFALRYSKNGGVYSVLQVHAEEPVEPAGDTINYIESLSTNGTTTGSPSGSGTFRGGQHDKNDANVITLFLASGQQWTVHEFAIRFKASWTGGTAQDGDFYDFRLYTSAGNPLAGYSTTLRATINIPATPYDWDTASFGNLEGHRHFVRASNGDLYATALVGTDVTVFKSTDEGVNWTELDYENRPSNADSGFRDVPVAIDSSDNLHIAYPNGGQNYTYVLFNTSSETYGTPETVAMTAGSVEASRGAIAVDSNDVPHLVARGFDDLSFSNHAIRYRNRVGGSWNAVVNVEGIGSTVYVSPAIAIDSSNVPIIAYSKGTNQQAAIGNANNATSFTAHTVVASSGAACDVAISGSGDVWIAYRAASTNEITLVRHAAADGWTTWQTPTSSGQVGNNPSLVIDGSNRIVLYIAATGNGNVAANTFGASWSGPTTLHTGSFASARARWQRINNPSYNGEVEYIYYGTTTPRIRYGTYEIPSSGTPKDVSDDLTVALTDTISIDKDLGLSDDLTIALVDTISIDKDMGLGDSIAVSLVDSISVDTGGSTPVDVSDTLAVALTDSISIDKAIEIGDSMAVTLSDSMDLEKQIDLSDTIAVSVTDNVSVDTGESSVPTGLVATAVSSSQIDLVWDEFTGAAGYDIERDGSVIAEDVVGTSYEDMGLSPSTLYTYRVRAVL